jgi:hypothetical protein
MTTRTPECRCLNCGTRLSAATGNEYDNPPQEGAIMVCMRCGAIMAFDDELQVRCLTAAEAQAVAADTELLRELAAVVLKVRLVQRN